MRQIRANTFLTMKQRNEEQQWGTSVRHRTQLSASENESHALNITERRRAFNIKLRRVRGNVPAVERQWVLHKQTVCLAAGIQQATRIRHVVICVLQVLKYFSTLSEKNHDLKKKVTKVFEKNVCFYFSTAFVWNIFHSKNNWTRCDQKRILRLMLLAFLSDL